MDGYKTCAIEGVTSDYEPDREGCINPAAGFACLDIAPSGSQAKARPRPACLPRGAENNPFHAYNDKNKNVAVKGDGPGKLPDHGVNRHVIRGSQYQETEVCDVRPTRRESYNKVAYSSVVGFRCAYDKDPAAAQ